MSTRGGCRIDSLTLISPVQANLLRRQPKDVSSHTAVTPSQHAPIAGISHAEGRISQRSYFTNPRSGFISLKKARSRVLFSGGGEGNRSRLRARSGRDLACPRHAIQHAPVRFPYVLEQQKKPPSGALSVDGGGEGNRTPVRKPVHGVFSERSRSSGFPAAYADRQAYTAGSFISS